MKLQSFQLFITFLIDVNKVTSKLDDGKKRMDQNNNT